MADIISHPSPPTQMADQLPIYPHLGAIVYHALRHRVSCVMADTGSGKSTQIPVALVAQGRKVMVTTPTVASARSLSRFVQAKYPHLHVGFAAGGEIRYQVETHPLVYCTAGHLYRALMRQCQERQPLLGGYDMLMLDECHVTTLDYDLLEFLIKYVWARAHFHLLISSATLDPEAIKIRWRWSDQGSDVHITQIHVPHLPVAIQYHPTMIGMDEEKGSNQELLQTIRQLIVRCNHTAPEGHFLVFLPGSADIDTLYDMLYEEESLSNTEVYPAYASLPEEDLSRAMDQAVPLPGDRRRALILATDVFETSVTIPGIVLVIDSGRVKVMRMTDQDIHATRLVPEWTSTFSITQRKGRTGRTNPGTVYRLFTPEHEQQMCQKVDREIDRVPLFAVIIQFLHHGLDPSQILPEHLRNRIDLSVRHLQELGLILPHQRLSDEARQVVNLPLEIHYGVMLYRLPRHPLAVLLAAILQSIQGTSFFYRPRRNRGESSMDYLERLMLHREQYYQRFAGTTDLITMLHIVVTMIQETARLRMSPVKRINTWCRENSMNARTMRSVMGLYHRLLSTLKVSGEDSATFDLKTIESWMTQVTDPLVRIFGRDSHFTMVDQRGEKWIREGSPLVYFMGHEASSCHTHILALSRYHVVKGRQTLGFISCLVNLGDMMSEKK